MNKKLKYLLHLLGPAVFVYILSQINFGLLKEELLTLNIYFLVLAAFFSIIQIITRSLKWRAILSGLGIELSRTSSISLYWLGTFIGVVTPGRLGELAKVYFLKNRRQSAFRSFLSVLLDRIIDIFILLIFGVLIFYFFLREIGNYIIFIGLGLILFLALIFFLINKRSFLHKFFSSREGSKFTFNKFSILPVFIYLIISWLFYFASRYMISLSLGLELSFLEVSIISVLVVLVTMLPISVAGIGTRDAAVIYLFSLFALNKEIALSFSLLILVVDLLTISLGLIPYLKESKLVGKVKLYASRPENQ